MRPSKAAFAPTFKPEPAVRHDSRSVTRYCSGSSASCTGQTAYGSWQTEEVCGPDELCDASSGDCDYDDSCGGGCSSYTCGQGYSGGYYVDKVYCSDSSLVDTCSTHEICNADDGECVWVNLSVSSDGPRICPDGTVFGMGFGTYPEAVLVGSVSADSPDDIDYATYCLQKGSTSYCWNADVDSLGNVVMDVGSGGVQATATSIGTSWTAYLLVTYEGHAAVKLTWACSYSTGSYSVCN